MTRIERFLAVVSRDVRDRNPHLIPLWDRDYAVKPALGWQMANDAPYSYSQYETDSYAQAVDAAKGLLFCGAEYVTVRWYSFDRKTETFETWRAL